MDMDQRARATPGGALGVVPPEDLRGRVAALLRRDGERVTMTRLGFSRVVFARVLAGLTVRAGTVALLRERLAAVDDKDRNPNPNPDP